MLIPLLLSLILLLFGIHAESTERVLLQSLDFETDFDAILSTCICDVTLTTIDKDQQPRIEIEGEADTLHHIRLGFELINQNTRLYNFFAVGLNSSRIHVQIYLKNNLQRYVHVGDGDIATFGRRSLASGADKFIFEHYGTGYVNMKLNVPVFEANLQGSGVYQFNGVVKNEATYRTTGRGYLDATRVVTGKVQVLAEDNSEVIVDAQSDIQIKAADHSKVFYRLTPGVKPKKLYQNDDSCIMQIQ